MEKQKNIKKYLTNIAYILEEYDKDGNKIERDRSNTESRPSVYPNKTAEELNSTDKNNYKGNDSNPSVDSDTNNDTYFKGQEDEDDFEKVVLLPKPFDLKLMKYISAINDKPTTRTITIDSSNLNKVVNGKVVTTADYDVSKVPLLVKTGDYVTYTFRIYNEGEVDGYAKEISEDIPEGLEYDASVNKMVNLSIEKLVETNKIIPYTVDNSLYSPRGFLLRETVLDCLYKLKKQYKIPTYMLVNIAIRNALVDEGLIEEK